MAKKCIICNENDAFYIAAQLCKKCYHRQYRMTREGRDEPFHYDQGLLRQCKDCGIWKDRETEYHSTGQKHYRKRSCKRCQQEFNRLRLYGLSIESYEQLKEEQKSCCAICGDKTDLYVDHSHKTNVVRGLLCNLCNCGLGYMKDDTQILSKAITYLSGNDEEQET